MDRERVVVLGDSFVAGMGDPTGAGWVGQMQRRLDAAAVPAELIRRGTGGDTSVDVARRWAHDLSRELGEGGRRGRVVLSFGANDTTGFAGRTWIAHDRSVQMLDELLADAATRGLAAFVVGIGAVDDEAQNARSRALEEAFAERCAARGVPFAPVLDALIADGTWIREAAAGDGAHPGAAGYEVLCELIVRSGFVDWLGGAAIESPASRVDAER